MEKNLSNPIIVKNSDGKFQLLDDDSGTLQSNSVQRRIKDLSPYFENIDKYIFKKDVVYTQIESTIKKINKKLKRKGLPVILTDDNVEKFIEKSKYYIKEQSEAGLTIKDGDRRWDEQFNQFKKIIAEEITRPLKPLQEQASFYLTVMKRAANFSVPGAGKTAMMYGTFAYLSSPRIDKVDKLLVISPLNAFTAWRTEYQEVFGDKRELTYMNLRDGKYSSNNEQNVIRDWVRADVITVNYESLQSNVKMLNKLVNEKTMIVFDEVHRIKGINGQRAKAALNLSKEPKYRYVLTGTPIPNGFKDIYNFLHLMYPDEYSSFFAWSLNDLEYIEAEDVNEKLAPFFWRTNKRDLNVPLPDDDNIIKVEPSDKQKILAEAIYENENGALARIIRLLQASTNPELLKYNINYRDLGLIDGESKEWDQNKVGIEAENQSDTKIYETFSLDQIETPKFDRGIELVANLVSEGKKVLVWGMFVGTMEKINQSLKKRGIKTVLVYGATKKDEREGLINYFREGAGQVLISNPNTLGESISLHKTVHDAVYFEYNFNLTFMLQSRDRINRLGLPEDQYTRYYYLMSNGDVAHTSFIDERVYQSLKEKEAVMLEAIDGPLLVPEYTDDYMDEIIRIASGN